MLFLNSIMLLGLLGIALPLLLHLFNRRKSNRRAWGAMMFLTASLAQRRRRVLIEEILLMVTRCLIVSFAAIAFARPFVSAASNVLWLFTGVAGLLAIILFAASAAVWSDRRLRARLWIASGALAAFAIAAIMTEGITGWLKTSKAGAKDVAIIIDGSASMTITSDGVRNFDKAKEIADDFIQSCPRNTAFSLIVGGSVSQELTKSPTTDRQLLLRLLDEAVPLQGSLKAPDALALAVTSLAQGYNGNKQIIVIGDGQSTGWALGDEQVWAGISELLSRLPRKPGIIWRTLPIPTGLRNVTVDKLEFSREVIGTDREVRIDVTLVNNGMESATPESLSLIVEGKTMKDSSIGQILPGEKRQVSFRHKFSKAGTHAVAANLNIDDELSSDNSLTRIAAVRSGFKVLVVEGAAAKRLSDRPGAFIALALSPDVSVTASEITEAAKNKQPQHRPNNGQPQKPRANFLVTPKLVSAAAFNTMSNLTEYSVIVFADVPRIPSNTATRVASYVERGGGLMTVHSTRTKPDFYNDWRDPDGMPFMPLVLEGDAPLFGEGSPVDPKTLIHPAITDLTTHGDLGTALFENTWKTSESTASGIRIGGRLFSGAPLFADRKYGKGRILQFAAALDPASGNLISRQSFLPMVHELTYYLARPVVPNLNIGPSRGASIQLAGGFLPDADEASSSEGLRGMYFADESRTRLIRSRIDNKFDMEWRNTSIDPSLPPDAKVIVEWTGSITVPQTAKYTIYANCSYPVTIEFPDDSQDFSFSKSRISVDLSAGRRHDIKITYNGKNRNGAYMHLRWQAPGIPDQIIPARYLSPVRTTVSNWSETYHTTFIAPDSVEPLPATLALTQNSLSAKISHRLTPGVYTINVPSGFAPQLADFASATAKRGQDKNAPAGPADILPISFCVSTDGSESLLTAVTPEDAAFASRFAELVLAADDSDMDRAVNGAKVGRELWRYAAVPLLLLIVLEIFLTRWITLQRRTGQEGKVEFDESNRPNSRFTEILQQMRNGGK